MSEREFDTPAQKEAFRAGQRAARKAVRELRDREKISQVPEITSSLSLKKPA